MSRPDRRRAGSERHSFNEPPRQFGAGLPRLGDPRVCIRRPSDHTKCKEHAETPARPARTPNRGAGGP